VDLNMEEPLEPQASSTSAQTPHPTGVPGLDLIFNGGFTEGSVYLVEGLAGTGKTTLANQIAFEYVRQGRHVLYFSVMAESFSKLFRQLRSMSFFDERQVGQLIRYLSGSGTLLQDGPGRFFDVMHDNLLKDQPDLFVLDGFRLLPTTASEEVNLCGFVHELCTLAATARCTVLLLSPSLPPASQTLHTLIDGLVTLSQENVDMQTLRLLELRKLRAASHLQGRHRFSITEHGMAVYPRLESLATRKTEEAALPSQEMAAIGLPGLDDALGGGLQRGTVGQIVGPPGSGKKLLGLKFLETGCKLGEHGLYLSLREPPNALIGEVAQFGIFLSEALAEGKLFLHWCPPLVCPIDRFAAELMAMIRAHGIRRLLVDALDELMQLTVDRERVRGFLAALTFALARLGVTTVFAEEQGLGDKPRPPHSILPLACIMLVGYREGRRVITSFKKAGGLGSWRELEFAVHAGALEVTARGEQPQLAI